MIGVFTLDAALDHHHVHKRITELERARGKAWAGKTTCKLAWFARGQTGGLHTVSNTKLAAEEDAGLFRCSFVGRVAFDDANYRTLFEYVDAAAEVYRGTRMWYLDGAARARRRSRRRTRRRAAGSTSSRRAPCSSLSSTTRASNLSAANYGAFSIEDGIQMVKTLSALFGR